MFQTKVATVPGGIEMILAAGYVVVDKSDGTTAPTEGSSSPKEGGSNGDNAANDTMFLVHSMDAGSELKLRYTLARVKELVDSTSN